MTSAVARLPSARQIRIIRPLRISASDSRTATAAAASLRDRRPATSFSNSRASARFSVTTLVPVLAATSSFCLRSKILPSPLPVLTNSSTSFDVSVSLKAEVAFARCPAAAVNRSLTGGSKSADGRSAASTRRPSMRLDSARNSRIACSETSSLSASAASVFLTTAGSLSSAADCRPIVRVNPASSAIGDGLHQPVKIRLHPIGGLVELCRILRGECADGLVEFLACGGQKLGGLLALGRILCGKKTRCSGADVTGGSDDLGGERDLGQTPFGDCAERVPKAVVGDNRAAARQHGERSDDPEGQEQSTAKAKVIPRRRSLHRQSPCSNRKTGPRTSWIFLRRFAAFCVYDPDFSRRSTALKLPSAWITVRNT